MVAAFLQSWPLFCNTYIAAVMLGMTLAVLGVVTLARNQIFLGLAASQAATLGTSVGLWCLIAWFGAEYQLTHSDLFLPTMAIGSSILTVYLSGRSRGTRQGRTGSEEAVSGVIYLLSISGALVLLSQNPFGLEEVERIVKSSLIGASRVDAWVFSGAAVVTAAVFTILRRDLALYALDPEYSELIGGGERRLRLLTTLLLGAVLGFGIHVAGVVFVAGALVLPPLLARAVCRETQSMFVVSPLCFLLLSLPAFVVAHEYDIPPGQMVVSLLAVTVSVVWAGSWVWERSFHSADKL